MKILRFFQFNYNYALNLYYKSTYIVIYVNDLQIIGRKLELINYLNLDSGSQFKITNFSSTLYYLVMKITKTKYRITITQNMYIN